MIEEDKKYIGLIEKLGWAHYGRDEAIFTNLKLFCNAMPMKGPGYHKYTSEYDVLTEATGSSAATWMLIYEFLRLDWMEYGCSPRFAWVQDDGEFLCDYVRSHSIEELLDIFDKRD